jgi:choline dehydrogenase-like flavoprotein
LRFSLVLRGGVGCLESPAPEMAMQDRCEAVVIGTGFGGAINACRLSKKWPGKVVVLERGKRYGLGQFPRAPGDFKKNFWALHDGTLRLRACR